ncbi:flagellar hook-length control protein FliK [Domibacillus enclensis]|nr:flagellar hook-length control protein FliK [Domibacillus enclensis]SIQ66121.1 Flagellar hook-length control protein FliK [Domibacillus enclensis]
MQVIVGSKSTAFLGTAIPNKSNALTQGTTSASVNNQVLGASQTFLNTSFQGSMQGMRSFGQMLQNAQQPISETAEVLENDTPIDAASLLLNSTGELELQSILDNEDEGAAIASDLLSNGDLPNIQDLAVMLGLDAETLIQSMEKVAQMGNENSSIEDMRSFMIENELSIEKLIHLTVMATEQGMHAVKEGDLQAIRTVLKASQIVQAFGQQATALPDSKKEAMLHLKAVLAQAAVAQQSPSQASAAPKQTILQAAFAQYAADQPVVQENKSVKPVATTVESINPFTIQMSKTEQFVMSVKTNPGPMNMEQFIEKFTQLLGNSNLMKTPNGTRMLIKLYPEQLGSLRIELLQQNGVMTAKILSSTQAVKELLEQNAHQLKNAFSQQNVTVDKLDIASPDTRQQLFDRGAQQQRQQEQKQPHDESKQNDQEPNASFEELLLHAEWEG